MGLWAEADRTLVELVGALGNLVLVLPLMNREAEGNSFTWELSNFSPVNPGA